MKKLMIGLVVLLGVGCGIVSWAADFDGDGTNDIGIYRASAGMWAIRNLTRVYFGGSSDDPRPGDYNGDGTVDFGLFRPTSGMWAVRDITRVYFGGSSDEPLAGIAAGGGGLWSRNGSDIYYNSGSVGIGTTSPASDLDVRDTGDADSVATLALHGFGANSNSFIEFWESGAIAMSMRYNGTANKLYLYDETQDAHRVTFERTGDVGIGTTNPGARLHVSGGNNDVGLIVRGGHSGGPPYNDLATFYNGDGAMAFWFAAHGVAGANDGWTTFSPYISMHFIPEDKEEADYEVGDLVCAIDRVAVKTKEAFDQAVVGVICPPDGFISIPTELKKPITEEGKKLEEFKLVPVAYIGDVRVKVNDEGGAIRSGDLIVPSSVPGVAMKGEPETFQQYSSVIGKARQNFEGASGLIRVTLGVK